MSDINQLLNLHFYIWNIWLFTLDHHIYYIYGEKNNEKVLIRESFT